MNTHPATEKQDFAGAQHFSKKLLKLNIWNISCLSYNNLAVKVNELVLFSRVRSVQISLKNIAALMFEYV